MRRGRRRPDPAPPRGPASRAMTLLPRDFFARDVAAVARELIGARLFFDGVGGEIVETEAYDHEDPASHSFPGPTPRNAVMFGPPGHAYVYLSYGIHWCLNVVCGPQGRGAAVLLRALRPMQGLDRMRERRGAVGERLLCAGPGRLAQALGITRQQNGHALDAPPFRLLAAGDMPPVAAGARIGISKAVETPWRFGLADSPYLSRPFPSAGQRALR